MIFLHVNCTLTHFILTNQDPVGKKQNYVNDFSDGPYG